MKKVLSIVLFLTTCFSLIATSSLAEIVLQHKKTKVINYMVTTDGIEFVVETKRDGNEINITPASQPPECINQFIIPSTADNFDVKAAVLLSARMKNEKIMLEYDIASTDCWVEAVSVGVADKM